MAKRNCFYSFHYLPDNWRAATVRNIGAIEGNKPASDNNWETVTKGGDDAIKKWIANEMSGKSCIVVLVGSNTAGRKWINHEIIKGWDDGKGVVGIYVNGLKDSDGNVSIKGNNPFDSIGYGNTGKKLSSIVKCYNPAGSNSQERYDWISKHLANAVEEAITIRKNN
ncbi:MAG: TIR domain-containing protein [Sphaerochaeta sp.]